MSARRGECHGHDSLRRLAQHLEEYLLFGSFFIAVAILELAWAMLVLFRPSPAVYLAGFVGDAAVAATSLVSRTTGLPLGPESGEPEPVGVANTVAIAARWRSRSSRSRSSDSNPDLRRDRPVRRNRLQPATARNHRLEQAFPRLANRL
jgi:hypothetical protein